MATTKAKAPAKSTGKAAPSKTASKTTVSKKPAAKTAPVKKPVADKVTATPVIVEAKPVPEELNKSEIAPWEDDTTQESQAQELADLINSARGVFQVTDEKPEPKKAIEVEVQTEVILDNAINAPRMRAIKPGTLTMSEVLTSQRNKRTEVERRSNPLSSIFKFK